MIKFQVLHCGSRRPMCMKMISESPVESRSLVFFPGKQDILRGDLVKDKNKIDEKFDAKCT